MPLTLERQGSSTTSKASPEATYPTISKDRATALAALIRKLELQGELNIDKGSDAASKFRAKAKEKFTAALVAFFKQ